MLNIDQLDWAKGGGLLPAIVQDADSGRVLMLGYMNAEALAETRRSGLVTFFSRSRNRLWTKGEGSGHTLALAAIAADCDGDALLVQARPAGPTCHRGTTSCFGDAPVPAVAFLAELERTITRRLDQPRPGSYTASLAAAGVKRAAQKLGEEGVEAALAAVAGDQAELLEESADLLYHLLVLLRMSGLGLDGVARVLRERHAARGEPRV